MNTVRILDQAFVVNQPYLASRCQRLFETFKSEICFPEPEITKNAGDGLNWLLTFSILNKTPFQDYGMSNAVQPITCVDSLFLFHFDSNHKKKCEEMTLPGLGPLLVTTDPAEHKIPIPSIHHNHKPVDE